MRKCPLSRRCEAGHGEDPIFGASVRLTCEGHEARPARDHLPEAGADSRGAACRPDQGAQRQPDGPRATITRARHGGGDRCRLDRHDHQARGRGRAQASRPADSAAGPPGVGGHRLRPDVARHAYAGTVAGRGHRSGLGASPSRLALAPGSTSGSRASHQAGRPGSSPGDGYGRPPPCTGSTRSPPASTVIPPGPRPPRPVGRGRAPSPTASASPRPEPTTSASASSGTRVRLGNLGICVGLQAAGRAAAARAFKKLSAGSPILGPGPSRGVG